MRGDDEDRRDEHAEHESDDEEWGQEGMPELREQAADDRAHRDAARAREEREPADKLRVEAIAESLLRTEQGFTQLKRYPASLNPESLFEPAERESVSNGLEWARNEHMRYALTGTVSEWRYKVGVDGEPVVGVALQLIDVNTGQVVWSAAGSRTGWSRSAVSGVAQKLLRRLLTPLEAD